MLAVQQDVRFDQVTSEVVDSHVALQVTFGFLHNNGVEPAVLVEFPNGTQYIYSGNPEVMLEFMNVVQQHVNNPEVTRIGRYFNEHVRPLTTLRVA